MQISSEALLEALGRILSDAIELAPFWLAPGLGFIFFRVWLYYRRAAYLAVRQQALLEIKLPEEIFKTPLAMELVLNALHNTAGESTWYDRYVLGKVRSDFSLEMVSLEGDVHFFIRTPVRDKKFVETQVYSQYPRVEVYEVPDYTESVPYGAEGEQWDLFGAEFGLEKEDPYPIKTYVDYGLAQPAKEEEKADPITPMIEYLGGLGKGEQAWAQILVRANKGKKDPTSPWTRDWQEEGKKLIEEIYENAKDRSGPPPELTEGVLPPDRRFAVLTEGERDVIKAIERSTSKLGFDCGIRAIYVAEKDHFNPENISGLFGTLKQYNSNDLNGFRPTKVTIFSYPWEEYFGMTHPGLSPSVVSFKKGMRMARVKWKLFDAYRRRSWFFPPYARKPFVLNTEELATIYHFPGGVAETPTFGRIESKKAEPPANLPT